MVKVRDGDLKGYCYWEGPSAVLLGAYDATREVVEKQTILR